MLKLMCTLHFARALTDVGCCVRDSNARTDSGENELESSCMLLWLTVKFNGVCNSTAENHMKFTRAHTHTHHRTYDFGSLYTERFLECVSFAQHTDWAYVSRISGNGRGSSDDVDGSVLGGVFCYIVNVARGSWLMARRSYRCFSNICTILFAAGTVCVCAQCETTQRMSEPFFKCYICAKRVTTAWWMNHERMLNEHEAWLYMM